MSVDSVSSNKTSVFGWTLGGLGTGATVGAGVGYLVSNPVKNGEFKDSFIKSSIKTVSKEAEQEANVTINILENAAKKTNVDDIAQYLKENLTKIDGAGTGFEIAGTNIDEIVDLIKSSEIDEAKKFITDCLENVKQMKQGEINSISKENIEKTFKYAMDIDGKSFKFKDVGEQTKEIKDIFEKCAKDFRKSRMLLWGGIAAGVCGLAGLVIGLNKKNNA